MIGALARFMSRPSASTRGGDSPRCPKIGRAHQLRQVRRRMVGQTRIGLAVLAFSAAGLVGIAVREGYSDKAYPDPVLGTKVPTIGFGTTGGVKMGDTTTPPKALGRALTDVQKFEAAIKGCVKVPLHQHEYDAYVSLSYNIGQTAFCNSTIVKRLNVSDYAGACNAILAWKYVGSVDCSTPGNRICAGLWTDRQRLHAQCVGGQ